MRFAQLPSYRPDPGPARDLIRAELAKSEYQPSLLSRITGWLNDLINAALGAISGVGRLDPVVALIAVAVLLVGIAFVLARLRPEPRRPAVPGAVLPERPATAAEHRRHAERALAEGRFDDAVVEGMRAIAIGLVERAILDDRPGATAREVADGAARRFPGQADELRAVAELFDIVRYGGRPADAATAARVLDVERELRTTSPVAATAGPATPAVPR